MIVTAAYYEAGHALLAVAVGNPIVRVTIRRRGNVLGSVHHRGVDLTQSADEVGNATPRVTAAAPAHVKQRAE
jgi:hypothetical protein